MGKQSSSCSKASFFSRRFKIFSFIVFILFFLLALFYIYLYFQFKTGDFVYNSEMGLGEVKGVSVSGEYFVEWESGNLTKESLSSLESGRKMSEDDISLVVKKENLPDYVFYPVEDGEKVMILSEPATGEVVVGSDIISSYEEKGEFILRVGESHCKPDFSCGNWGECRSSYSLETLISGDLVAGIRYRYCRDLAKCLSNFIDSEECNIKREVYLNKSYSGNETYLGVYSSEGESISSLSFGEGTLDIEISP